MLIDTAGLLCLHDFNEPGHETAVAHFSGAVARLTHSYVLAEFVALSRARGLDRSRALLFLNELIANPLIEIVWVDELLHGFGMALLADRLDKSYSLCDANSFVIMRHRAISQVLTTDHHFEQEGFQRLLRKPPL